MHDARADDPNRELNINFPPSKRINKISGSTKKPERPCRWMSGELDRRWPLISIARLSSTHRMMRAVQSYDEVSGCALGALPNVGTAVFFRAIHPGRTLSVLVYLLPARVCGGEDHASLIAPVAVLRPVGRMRRPARAARGTGSGGMGEGGNSAGQSSPTVQLPCFCRRPGK